MLRLSREADYSLLAMVYIAARPQGQLACRGDIAAHYSIPKEFLAKVLQKLSRRGLIKSHRGMQGGYQLARSAEEISLADVVEAVDGPMALVDCQRGLCDCPQEPVCTVQETLNDLQREIRKAFGNVTLKDMEARSRGVTGRQPGLLQVETRQKGTDIT